MTGDPFAHLKAVQREAWAAFSPQATFTVPPAASLVAFAGVRSGDLVLDVACGTGVVAVTAARIGARVRGLDLAPAVLADARKNAAVAAAEYHDEGSGRVGQRHQETTDKEKERSRRGRNQAAGCD